MASDDYKLGLIRILVKQKMIVYPSGRYYWLGRLVDFGRMNLNLLWNSFY